jgi:hypothetical protein
MADQSVGQRGRARGDPGPAPAGFLARAVGEILRSAGTPSARRFGHVVLGERIGFGSGFRRPAASPGAHVFGPVVSGPLPARRRAGARGGPARQHTRRRHPTRRHRRHHGTRSFPRHSSVRGGGLVFQRVDEPGAFGAQMAITAPEHRTFGLRAVNPGICSRRTDRSSSPSAGSIESPRGDQNSTSRSESLPRCLLLPGPPDGYVRRPPDRALGRWRQPA